MDWRLAYCIAVAGPLAATGIACLDDVRARDTMVAAAPRAIEHCRRAAQLLYDVTWAAACSASKADDPTDCTLPDSDAARVNAILQVEEARCLAIEAHASRAP